MVFFGINMPLRDPSMPILHTTRWILHDNSWARVLSQIIFELHLKIIEHVLKYVAHRILSTVLKYALRIFELLGPVVPK